MRSYIRVGVVGGLIVGLLFALYTGVVFVPHMEQAEIHEHHATNDPEPHAHSESQPIIGSIGGVELMTLLGAIAWVTTLGVLAAIGFYFAEPMLESHGRHTRGVFVGLAGFVALRVVPWTVYHPVSPAADFALPEAVYIPWYWALVTVTGLTFFSMPFIYRHLDQAYTTQTAKPGLIAVALIPVVAVVVAPTNAIESVGAPVSLHYRYIATVVGGQLAVWIGLGLFVGHFAGVDLSAEQSVDTTRSHG